MTRTVQRKGGLAIEPITITYRIGPEDYERAQSLVSNLRRLHRVLVAVMAVLAVLGFLGNALSEPVAGHWSSTEYALFVGGAVGFSAVMFLVYTPWVQRRRLRRLYDQQKGLHNELTVVISEESLHVRTERGESKIPWEQFHKWKSAEDMVLVFESDVIMHIYPRPAFASQADYDAFRDLLTRKLGPAKK